MTEFTVGLPLLDLYGEETVVQPIHFKEDKVLSSIVYDYGLYQFVLYSAASSNAHFAKTGLTVSPQYYTVGLLLKVYDRH